MVLTADDFAFFVTEHGLDPRLVLDAPPVSGPLGDVARTRAAGKGRELARATTGKACSVQRKRLTPMSVPAGHHLLCHPAH